MGFAKRIWTVHNFLFLLIIILRISRGYLVGSSVLEAFSLQYSAASQTESNFFIHQYNWCKLLSEFFPRVWKKNADTTSPSPDPSFPTPLHFFNSIIKRFETLECKFTLTSHTQFIRKSEFSRVDLSNHLHLRFLVVWTVSLLSENVVKEKNSDFKHGWKLVRNGLCLKTRQWMTAPRKSSAVVHKVRVEFSLKIVVDLSNEKILNSACLLN